MKNHARSLAMAAILATVSTLGGALSMRVEAQDKQPKIFTEIKEFKGSVVAVREAEVSPRFDGLLNKIHFVPGQFVKEGALLFEFLETEKALLLEIDRAKSQRTEAQLRIAEARYKNNRTLRQRNIASEMQFLESETARDVAAANAAEARASVRLSEFTLKEMKLYAPITGMISRPFVAEGTYITRSARAQSKLALVIQLDPIRVVGRVPFDTYFQRREILKTDEQTIERLEFSIILPNGERFPHTGKIVGGGYEFNRETQMLEILVELPNPNYLLRPGLQVTLQSRINSGNSAHGRR